MSKRQKIWARNLLAEIRQRLGGKCTLCGAVENLELDCINPEGDKHHKMSTDQRASFYRVQHAINNLQLLCEKCHNKKSSTENPYQISLTEYENHEQSNSDEDPF